MKQNKPKVYIRGFVAAIKLINLAMEHMATLRSGVTVHWQIKISYRYTPEAKKLWKGPAIPMGFTVSSGEEIEGL